MADTKTHSKTVRAKIIRHLINTSMAIGGGVAGFLSLTTYLQRESVVKGLTTNLAVQSAAKTIFPAVLVTQVLKGLAYPTNGIIMGGLDWTFTMIAMWAANLVCLGILKGPGVGLQPPSLVRTWWALAAFMATQVVTAIVRFQSKTGVWSALRYENSENGAN